MPDDINPLAHTNIDAERGFLSKFLSLARIVILGRVSLNNMPLDEPHITLEACAWKGGFHRARSCASSVCWALK